MNCCAKSEYNDMLRYNRREEISPRQGIFRLFIFVYGVDNFWLSKTLSVSFYNFLICRERPLGIWWVLFKHKSIWQFFVVSHQGKFRFNILLSDNNEEEMNKTLFPFYKKRKNRKQILLALYSFPRAEGKSWPSDPFVVAQIPASWGLVPSHEPSIDA